MARAQRSGEHTSTPPRPNHRPRRTTVGVYQYVFLRVMVSVAMLICETQGLYVEGNWSPAYFYVWSTVSPRRAHVRALTRQRRARYATMVVNWQPQC